VGSGPSAIRSRVSNTQHDSDDRPDILLHASIFWRRIASGMTCRHAHLSSSEGSLRIRKLLCRRRRLLRLGIQRCDDCILRGASATLTPTWSLPCKACGLAWDTSLLSNCHSGTAYSIPHTAGCNMLRTAHSGYIACRAFVPHRVRGSGYPGSVQGGSWPHLLGSCGSQLLCQHLLVTHRLLRGCICGFQGSFCGRVARMQRLVGRLQRLEVRCSLAQQLCVQRTPARSAECRTKQSGLSQSD